MVHEDFRNQILVGNVMDKLRELPGEFIDCCVTSPPYYNLRCYSTEPQMWGGDANCQHEFTDAIRAARVGGTNSEMVHRKGSVNFQIVPDRTIGVCEKCGCFRGELGAEPTVSLFIDHLVSVFREVRRVLKPTGTCWVTIADSANGSGGAGGDYNEGGMREGQARFKGSQDKGLKPLDQCGVPFSFALAMREDGWYLRDTIIWISNKMPESMQGWRYERCKRKVAENRTQNQKYSTAGTNRDHKGLGLQGTYAEYESCPGCEKCSKNDGYVLRRGSGRCTRAYEFVFMFAKTKNYYYDSFAIREKAACTFRNDTLPKSSAKYVDRNIFSEGALNGSHHDVAERWPQNGVPMRTCRSAWFIPSEPQGSIELDGKTISHYAAFPKELVRRMIMAGSPVAVCASCGAPHARVIDEGEPLHEWKAPCGANAKGEYDGQSTKDYFIAMAQKVSTRWLPTCSCNAAAEKAVVMDIFGGSGTSALVALEEGRDYVLVELNPAYARLAQHRIEQTWLHVRQVGEKPERVNQEQQQQVLF